MIQASVNVAAIHSNNKAKKRYIQNRQVSEDYPDDVSSKNIQFRDKTGSPAPNSRIIHMKSNTNGENISPQKSESTFNINDMIRLNEFEEDIDSRNFGQIEKDIGRVNTKAIKFKTLLMNVHSRDGVSSSFISTATTNSNKGHHHNNHPIYDGWRDFLTQFIMYLFSINIIYPDHQFKLLWDKLVLLLLGYTAFEIPLHESFHIKFSAEFDMFVVAIFLFDIWLSFRTTYTDPKTNDFETDSKVVAIAYIKSWLFIDLWASLPMAEIASLIHANEHAEEVLALFHLLRLVKLPRLFRGFSTVSHKIAFSVLTVIFLMLSHFGACLFHMFGSQHVDEGWLIEDDLRYKGVFERYVSAFYWAMSSITTIGYGDIHAITFDERLFSCFMVFVSAIVYSICLATMSLILGEIYHA
eukprot:489747_1